VKVADDVPGTLVSNRVERSGVGTVLPLELALIEMILSVMFLTPTAEISVSSGAARFTGRTVEKPIQVSWFGMMRDIGAS